MLLPEGSCAPVDTSRTTLKPPTHGSLTRTSLFHKPVRTDGEPAAVREAGRDTSKDDMCRRSRKRLSGAGFPVGEWETSSAQAHHHGFGCTTRARAPACPGSLRRSHERRRWIGHIHRKQITFDWTAPVILEALIPGRMRSHVSTAEVSRGAARARGQDGVGDPPSGREGPG